MNRPGDPLVGRAEDWEVLERARLNFPPIRLTLREREAAEHLIPKVCVRGDWRYHIAAAAVDHVHVQLTAPPLRDQKAVRKWLKRWLGQELLDRLPDGIPRGGAADEPDAGATWWAEGGSIKWVWAEDYYKAVYNYIVCQRLTTFTRRPLGGSRTPG